MLRMRRGNVAGSTVIPVRLRLLTITAQFSAPHPPSKTKEMIASDKRTHGFAKAHYNSQAKAPTATVAATPATSSTSTSKSTSLQPPPPHFPVCIVGGGPVGLLMSTLLSAKGVQHCLLERRFEPTTHPQAHFMSMRTMEILRAHVPDVFEGIVKQVSPASNWR